MASANLTRERIISHIDSLSKYSIVIKKIYVTFETYQILTADIKATPGQFAINTKHGSVLIVSETDNR